MGDRGKLVERGQARVLRAQGWTLAEICAELGPPSTPVGARASAIAAASNA